MATRTLSFTLFPAFRLEIPQKDSYEPSLSHFPSSSHITIPPGKMAIKIPDMFNSFMAATPKVNPFYEEVKIEAEDWIAQKLNVSEKMKRIISKTDFAWFCAVAVPDAGRDELRTLCDWGNWVFPFDDRERYRHWLGDPLTHIVFDNGKWKDDPSAAQKVTDDLLLVMRGGDHQGVVSAFVEIHDTVWNRVRKTSTKAVQSRFLDAMIEYCNGALEHVGHHSEARNPELSEYLEVRRRGVGATPVIALMEYALRLDIPEDVYMLERFAKLKSIVVDVILIQNDIISYKKEQAEGVPHNLITVLRNSGLTTQESFDRAGEMLNQCYQKWLDMKAEFPAGVDAAKFVEGTRTIMLASLHWHFRSDRYFGEMKELVRDHRIVFLDQEARMVLSGLELVVSAFQAWMMTFKKHFGAFYSYFQG